MGDATNVARPFWLLSLSNRLATPLASLSLHLIAKRKKPATTRECANGENSLIAPGFSVSGFFLYRTFQIVKRLAGRSSRMLSQSSLAILIS